MDEDNFTIDEEEENEKIQIYEEDEARKILGI